MEGGESGKKGRVESRWASLYNPHTHTHTHPWQTFGSLLAYPTNIGITRATPTATPLVLISDGGRNLVALGCSKGSLFFSLLINTCSVVRTTHH